MNTNHLKGSDPCPNKSDKIRVYSMRFCPYAQRIRLVLWHKKIPFDTVNINLKDKPSFFLKLNPYGTVPVIEDHRDGYDFVIYESNACDWYVEEYFPENSLTESSKKTRVLNRMMMDAFSNVTSKYYQLAFGVGVDASKKAENLENLKKALKPFEQHLENKFYGGVKPSMLDLHIWPWFERFGPMEKIVQVDILRESEFPKLCNWVKVMWQLDCVKNTSFSDDDHIHFYQSYLTNSIPDYNYKIEEDKILK